MRVLVGCEESQAVTKAFRARGHEAYSCDLQPCSGGHPEWHYQQDIFEVIDMGWDLAIFHPPCTYLTYCGNRWFNIERYGQKAIERYKLQKDAIEFFMKLYNCNIPKICLENPRGVIQKVVKQSQIIQPYYFGDSFSKTTCLWLKNLPLLQHNKQPNLFDSNVTHVDKGEMTKHGSGSELMWGTHVLKMDKQDRSRHRSKTAPGIAAAMATQWG